MTCLSYELDGKGFPSPHAVAAKLGWADSLDNASLTTNGSTLFLDCITSDGSTAVTALNAYADTAAPEAPDTETQAPEAAPNPLPWREQVPSAPPSPWASSSSCFWLW